MAESLDTPKRNRILAALPIAEYRRLEPELDFLSLTQGQVLYELGDTLDFLYFPTTSALALIWTTAGGGLLELGITGNEGLVGLTAVFSSEISIFRVMVQSGGGAYRVRSEVARWVLDQDGELLHWAIAYDQVLIAQIAQVAFCNRHHSVEQQLCRWILICLDRSADAQINTTQAMIADRIGARRQAVSEAAGKLQTDGLISYSRGLITILDRTRLEARACVCYASISAQYAHLGHSVPSTVNTHRRVPDPRNLRIRAEIQLKAITVETPRTPSEVQMLLHELQVHQIELELQNDDLSNALAEVALLRDRQADIYDFAPVAYVTIETLGSICQINLSGAILLGIKRSEINRHRFGAFVAPDHLSAFNRFLSEVLVAGERRTCEIQLNPTGQRSFSIVHIEAVSDEDGRECRMVISDITAQKRLEKELANHRESLEAIVAFRPPQLGAPIEPTAA